MTALYEPARRWRVEDLANLPPEAPEHLELIYGTLVLRSPQRVWHVRIVDALVAALGASATHDLGVMREMTVVCGPRLAPEPDVCVVRRTAVLDPEVTMLDASDVRLVVEVVSPDSVTRDRKLKPRIYAAAGIPHYWIVDREGRTAVVRAHDLDPVRCIYGPATIFRDRVDALVPFPVSADLSEERLISGRRGA